MKNESNQTDASISLRLEKCTMRFGGLTAVNDFSFVVPPGGLVGLIGPNGAGKTTVFNMITGVYRPTSGEIMFGKVSLVGKRTNEICRVGLARTFQNIRLCSSLSVFENVQTALIKNIRYGFFTSALHLGNFSSEEARVTAVIHELLALFNLSAVAQEKATSLPYGDQRRVEIVRALATSPQLLLLDEPAAGMNPTEKTDLMRLIRKVRDEFNLSVLLIEHDMKVVMGICERITVLDYGAKIAEGAPDEIRRNSKVIEAYLGEAH